MNKIISLLSIALFVGIGFARAQEKSNLIKTSLTAPIINTYTLAYERILNSDMSIQIGGSYFAGWKLGDTRLDGFSIIPEYRYYLSEKRTVPGGGFVAPFLRYASTELESGVSGTPDYTKASLTNIGGGVLIGVQRLFKETISLEAFIGPAYNNMDVTMESGTEDNFSLGLFGGFSVRLGVTLGIGF